MMRTVVPSAQGGVASQAGRQSSARSCERDSGQRGEVALNVLAHEAVGEISCGNMFSTDKKVLKHRGCIFTRQRAGKKVLGGSRAAEEQWGKTGSNLLTTAVEQPSGAPALQHCSHGAFARELLQSSGSKG